MSKLSPRIFPDKILQGKAGDGYITQDIINRASASVSSSFNETLPGFAEQNGYIFYILDDIDTDIDNIRTYITASQETTEIDFYISGSTNTGSIEYLVESINTDSSTQLDSFATASASSFIYDYSLYSTSSGARAGQFMIATWDGNITFTDTSTKHLNDSSIPSLDAVISGDEVRVRISSGSGYRFKALLKKL